MSDTPSVAQSATPKLARHVRWREDDARDRWVLMAPERLYVPDAIALDVLKRLDGEKDVRTLVAELADDYDAPQEVIARDVSELIDDLVDKGLVAI